MRTNKWKQMNGAMHCVILRGSWKTDSSIVFHRYARTEFLCLNTCIKVTELLEIHWASVWCLLIMNFYPAYLWVFLSKFFSVRLQRTHLRRWKIRPCQWHYRLGPPTWNANFDWLPCSERHPRAPYVWNGGEHLVSSLITHLFTLLVAW